MFFKRENGTVPISFRPPGGNTCDFNVLINAFKFQCMIFYDLNVLYNLRIWSHMSNYHPCHYFKLGERRVPCAGCFLVPKTLKALLTASCLVVHSCLVRDSTRLAIASHDYLVAIACSSTSSALLIIAYPKCFPLLQKKTPTVSSNTRWLVVELSLMTDSSIWSHTTCKYRYQYTYFTGLPRCS